MQREAQFGILCWLALRVAVRPTGQFIVTFVVALSDATSEQEGVSLEDIAVVEV
jgi:hypothetical protein